MVLQSRLPRFLEFSYSWGPQAFLDFRLPGPSQATWPVSQINETTVANHRMKDKESNEDPPCAAK